MLDRRLRAGVERGLGPIGAALGRLGGTPDALTAFGLASAIATAFAVGSGHLAWGVVGIAASGLGDLLDGNLARSTGRTGPRGSFFDSVADRVSDAIVLGGIAWYLVDESPYMPMLAFAVAMLSMLISYERAKAESLAIEARGGLMERAERFVFLGVALTFNVLVPVLWLMLSLCALTVVTRFMKVWKAAADLPQAVETTAPTIDDAAERQAESAAELAGESHDGQRFSRVRRITPRNGQAKPVLERNSARVRDWWEARVPVARARAGRGAERPRTTRGHRQRRRPNPRNA